MDSATFTAVVSGAVPIVIATVSVGLTYVLTKKREREADWRKVKLELYKDYVNAVAGIVSGRATTESEVRYHDAFNAIGLVASPAVLAAVQAFQAEISSANTARTQASHDQKYTCVMNALRQDLTGRPGRRDSRVTFYMISKRPWSGSTVPTSK
jgi:hypothetical protein